MIFGDTPLDAAVGAILAHGVRRGDISFKKGRVLSAEDVARLRDGGLDSIVAARLEADDIGEDAAAAAVAGAATGAGLRRSAPFTGRVNLFAEADGLLIVERARLDRLNLVDEAITIATLAPHTRIAAKQMVATIKVIPFAARQASVEACAEIAGEGGPIVSLAPLRARRIGLIQSLLPGMKESIFDKTAETMRVRIDGLGSQLAGETRCAHTSAKIAAAIAAFAADGCDVVLIAGASAIVDRRDVIPLAIEAAGGGVDHFGMPVDPGNLMLLGHLDDIPVVGMPGCARSPKFNGFDWILERIAAGVPVGREDVMRMGAGGLLKEIGNRPQPRARTAGDDGHMRGGEPRIAVLVLAAGQSRRMGSINKLLAEIDGRPILARVVEAALASQGAPVVVVTGHEEARVRAALTGRDVEFVHNPRYTEGLSTSLHAGIGALSEDVDGAIICLGDMPHVAPAHLDRLIAAFDPDEGRLICVPTHRGKQGNPVLWARRHFAEIQAVTGDVGARHLIGEHDESICEVAMDDEGILIDIDTPEALAAATDGLEAEA